MRYAAWWFGAYCTMLGCGRHATRMIDTGGKRLPYCDRCAQRLTNIRR